MYILIHVSMKYQSEERGHEIEGEWGVYGRVWKEGKEGRNGWINYNLKNKMRCIIITGNGSSHQEWIWTQIAWPKISLLSLMSCTMHILHQHFHNNLQLLKQFKHTIRINTINPYNTIRSPILSFWIGLSKRFFKHTSYCCCFGYHPRWWK